MRFSYTNTVISGILVLFSCSIFEPRDSFEEPKDKTDVTDYFNFREILHCPQSEIDQVIVFKKVNLNDLFSDNLAYRDVNISKEFAKDAMVNRLNQIDKPDIVVWNNGSCTEKDDTIFIKDIEYTMFFSLYDSIRGVSDFTIVKDVSWQIVHWVNIPSDGTKASMLTPIQ